MTITAAHLLRDLDPLPFPARQRLLATTARSLPAVDLEGLLEGLAERGPYERQLALQIAGMAGHGGFVERRLADPDSGTAIRAAILAVRLGVAGDALPARLPVMPTAHRHAVYTAVRRHAAQALAEALLPIVEDRFGDRESAVLLAACSAATLDARLPDLGYAVSSWARIGHRHPAVLLDYVDAELATAPRADWAHLTARLSAGLGAASVAYPDRVLGILDLTAPYAAIPSPLARRLGALARHDAARLIGIMVRPGRAGILPGGRALWRGLLSASDDDLVRYARALGPGALPGLLHVRPPARRLAIYDGVVGDGNAIGTGLPLAALDELPRAARTHQAHSLLGQRSVADHPATRLAVTARLPWAESGPALLAATRRSTAAERAAAYPLYIGAAAGTRDRDVVEQMIASLTRLPNEQEPVRSPAMESLAGIAPWLFTSAAAEMLARLAAEAAQARDASWRSHRAIRTLADRLIGAGAASDQVPLLNAGIAMIQALGGSASALDLHGLDRGLPRGSEHRVFDALQQRIGADERRGDYSVALALATGLHRRAWDMPELQAVIDRARNAKDDAVVRQAIELWLRPPATRDERCAAILRADRSTITIGAVRDAISLRRTDLLDDVLTKSLRGRFLKRGVRYIPIFSAGLSGWLPRQRTRYAELLANLAGSPTASTWERAQAVRLMGRIPGPPAAIRALVRDSEDQVADAAVAALAWADQPADVLPELLVLANGGRAQVAASAAARCARFVAPDALAGLIAPTLSSPRVTARKEAVRLLALHHSPDVLPLLMQTWTAPDQHRDVRRAIVSAGRLLLDDERMWPMLVEASGSDDLASAVLEVPPTSVGARHRGRYAGLVRAVASSPSADTALRGLAVLPQWARWDDGTSRELLVVLVTDLDRTATWRAALGGVIAYCERAEESSALVAVATRLLDGVRQEAAPTADRDQPARQRLEALADAVARSVRTGPTLRGAAADLADVISASRPERDIAVRLAVAGVPWEVAGEELTHLRALVRLADRPVLAWEAAALAGGGLSRTVRTLDPLRLRAVAEALGRDGTPSAAIVAVAIAGVAGAEAGWPTEWRPLVDDLRRHGDPDVRLAAARASTSAE